MYVKLCHYVTLEIISEAVYESDVLLQVIKVCIGCVICEKGTHVTQHDMTESHLKGGYNIFGYQSIVCYSCVTAGRSNQYHD